MTKSSSILSIMFKALMVLVLLRGCDALTILDPKTTGFNITGDAPLDEFGGSVRTAGDINNDGFEDIIIGANNVDSHSGAAYVIYGGPTSSLSDIDLGSKTLDPATTGFTIRGKNGDSLGSSVSTAGDINNDGYDDIIIGATSNTHGAVYVIYGGPKSSMSNIDLRVTILDPLTTGFMIKGNASSDFFGQAVSKAGDINHDGYGDIIIGAFGKDNLEGAAYVIYGGPKSSMSNIDLSNAILDPLTTGFMIAGGYAHNYFGLSVSGAGDINHDGYDDIIMGANVKYGFYGAAYVIYGAPKSLSSNIDLSLTALDPATTGFKISGTFLDSSGGSVDTAGDINNDGYDDIIFGTYMKNGLVGAAYVIYGGPKSSSSNIDLYSTALDPATTGFMISGNAVNDRLGWSVSTAGDINHDGYDDIIVGACEKSSLTGAAYVIYGGKKSSMSNIDLKTSTLDPATTGFVLTGEKGGDRFGYSVSTAGDVNNDGFKDIIIGAPWALGSGVAYVVYGGPKPSMTNCDQAKGSKLDEIKYLLGFIFLL